MIEPNMWDDDSFVALSVHSRLLWCYLKTCECFVPGLIRGSTLTFAEAMRFSADETAACFCELTDRHRIEFDEPRRLLRVVDDISPPSNQRIVKGWFRRWERLPESELKYRHLALLEVAICHRRDKPWAVEIWVETFGTVAVPGKSGPSQGRLFDGLQQGNGIRTVPEPSRNGKSSKGKQDGSLDGIETVSDTVSIRTSPDPDPAPDPSPDPETRNRMANRFPVEARLWDVQEDYRARLKLPRLVPTPEDLEGVRAGLEQTGFGEPEALLALKAHFLECDRDITKSRFFNGATNWLPANLRVAATRAPAPGNGRSASRPEPDLGEEARLAAREPRIDQEARSAFAAAWGGRSGHGSTEGVS